MQSDEILWVNEPMTIVCCTEPGRQSTQANRNIARKPFDQVVAADQSRRPCNPPVNT